MEGEKEIEWTPLIKASYHGHKKLITLLFEYGAQVDWQSKDRRTALMVASQNRHTEVVELLYEHYGAKVDLQNNNGWTALIVASLNGHKK